MHNAIKFVHTNLIAKDWKSLSKFYIDVFGCKPTYPERDLSGEWLEKITEIKSEKLIEHGGTLFGEVAQKQYPELGLLTVAYTRDPEGNFIELQNWKK
jgi:predicted enzyme related to lactoylglutathione lyase